MQFARARHKLTKRTTYKLGDFVRLLGGELIGNAGIAIRQVATLESATRGEISFVAQTRYLALLESTNASAVIVGNDGRDATKLPRIVCANPYAYYAAVAQLLNPDPPVVAGIDKCAVVRKSARVAKSACIGPCAVIEAGAQIGAKAVIGAGCYVGAGSRIGATTRLYPGVTVYHGCSIGERCILHSGVVIGADGFGIANEAGVWKKIPQIGGVTIGDDVEIGANTTIDRGALEDTVIGNGAKLDNQIQVAHNVSIGEHTAIAACVGIAGSARIGNHCTLGGASMIYGHITIADNVSVSAGTLIMKSLDEPGTYTGVYPFTSHQRWLRNAAQLRQLDELAKRVRDLERGLQDREKTPK
jgi:UDP-3-O-[3-hydroxymyristoyl] glucosamine N-acyltransferase